MYVNQGQGETAFILAANVELSCRKGPTKKPYYPGKHRRKIERSTVALALPVCLSDLLVYLPNFLGD